MAYYLVALGLGGVPLSVAASALVFFTWLATALLHQYVLAWMLRPDWRAVGGMAVLLLAAGLAIPLSARAHAPARPVRPARRASQRQPGGPGMRDHHRTGHAPLRPRGRGRPWRQHPYPGLGRGAERAGAPGARRDHRLRRAPATMKCKPLPKPFNQPLK
ncbi:hypothetical protein LP420_38935 [Massilia sp. B-10]|nr:hypothetical protein LP420_38935 [Massilia sp. B-10]